MNAAATTGFSSHYLACAGREIHYTEWGAQHAETVIAWHGLARTCRDMDDIAAHLARAYRVICPDTIGRGLSEWSPAPEREYCLAFYEQLAVALADQLGLAQFHWLGTSMGGLIGIGIGYSLSYMKEETVDGRFYTYDESSRRRGGQILFLSVVMLVVWIAII